MQQETLPVPSVAATDTPPGFRVGYWVGVVLFFVLSTVGAIVLIAYTPDCDVGASLRSSQDCSTRDEYILITVASIGGALFFGLVLCALGVVLNALARIEQRLSRG